MAKSTMKRIGLPQFTAVAVFTALLASALASEFDSPQKNGVTNSVTFSSPVVLGDRSNVSFNPVSVPHVAAGNSAFPVSVPVPLPVIQSQPGVPASGVSANNMLVSAPAVVARPVAQNATTKSHRLRIPPQTFEKNLVEKLGSRFVPVRNIAENSGIAQFRMPAKDGTEIELTVHRQQGMVSIAGSPGMVDASLRIVQLLDAVEGAGGPVARFVPVQQSNVNAVRRVANIVNQETIRVAQAAPPAVAAPLPLGLGEEELAAAGVVGPVQIEIIDAFGTVIIQGTPEDVRIIQGMLQQLEMLSLENEPIIELLAMRHRDSLRISSWAWQLYQTVYAPRWGAITVIPLVKPNTILILGRREGIDGFKSIVAKLDMPVNPNAAFRIFHLQHAAAQEVQTTINNAFNSRQGAGQYLAPFVSVIGDFRTNVLIVQASPSDILEVEAMIRQLDIPGSNVIANVKRFPLKNSLASDMATALNNALNASISGQRAAMVEGTDAQGNPLRGSVLYNATIVADTRGNSLLVTAPADTMTLIETLIRQLDQLPAAESRIKVFTLVNGDAFNLATILTNTFGAATTGTGTGAGQVASVVPGIAEGESTLVGARFQADIRTNSIIAVGSEADLINAEALLLRLDAENLNNRTVFTMRLINTPAEDLATILNSYNLNERQITIQNSTLYLPQSPLEQYRMETNIIAEPISNSLIISTTPRYYEEVRKIILTLDERPLMVAIDVLIAEVDITRNKDRGVEFGFQDSILFGTTTSTGIGQSIIQTVTPAINNGILGPVTGTVPFANTGSVGTQGITRLGMPNGTGFSFAASNEAVSIFVRALETQNKTQVLSRPRLVMLHNRNAAIEVGSRLPYEAGGTITTQGSVNTSTGFITVGTILDVTPRIMPDDMIALALYVERSNLASWVNIGNGQAPQTRVTTAQTTINAMDGQTVIFAGLITEERGTVNNSVPGLNKIPVIKHFFEYDSKTYRRSELLIVLTPRIIRTGEDMMKRNQQEYERMQWCVSDVVKLTGDHSIRRRSDAWYPGEVRHTHGTPVILNETQLPSENRIPIPMFPTIETK